MSKKSKLGKSALQQITRPGDVFMSESEIQRDDIVIPIMGQTGAGKSTVSSTRLIESTPVLSRSKFVNNVFKKTMARTDDGFTSCTEKLAHYIMQIPEKLATQYHIAGNRRVVLVDTPGFDDTNVSDSEILRRIAVWLAKSYGANTKVAGIVYIHPIYPNRMTRNDCSNVKVFRKICGDAGLSKVILATTRWDICPQSVGDNREKELNTNFWTNLLRDPNSTTGKARMKRLWNTSESAWDVIKAILERVAQSDIDSTILNIQEQLVRRNKKFQQTDAAKELRRKLVELLNESGSATSESRRERLRSLAQQIGDLKIPIGARIKAMLGLQ
ncbi:hypothetical protein MD484_g6178, partial [Candolleomyces efflorescens]